MSSAVTTEQALALKLRRIAAQIKIWEDRDFAELVATGSRTLSRPCYFADLEDVAAMLEGKHFEHRLRRSKAGRGRPGGVSNVDRDMAIAKLVDEVRLGQGGSVKAGLDAAIEQFHVSPKSAEKAWLRFGAAIGSGNEEIISYFEKLAMRGLVKSTRHKSSKK